MPMRIAFNAFLVPLLLALVWMGPARTGAVTRALADDPDLIGPAAPPSSHPTPKPTPHHRRHRPVRQEPAESDDDSADDTSPEVSPPSTTASPSPAMEAPASGTTPAAGTAAEPSSSSSTAPSPSPEAPKMTRLQELIDRSKRNGGRLPLPANVTLPMTVAPPTPHLEGTWEFFGNAGAGQGRAWVEEQTGDSFRGSFKGPLIAGKFDGEIRDGTVHIRAHWSLFIVRWKVVMTAPLPPPGTNPLRIQGHFHVSDGREGDFVATRTGD